MAEEGALAAIRVVFALCRTEAELSEAGAINAKAIKQTDQETQAAAREAFTQRRDEIRKERK